MIIDDILKKENWRSILENKNIIIKEDDNYIILKYDMVNVDFSDEIVQQCRGIIFRKSDMACVCRPFYKFFNYQESNACTIDWASAKVQQKVDGSIVKLWYDGEWKWSTNGVINAFNADISTISAVQTFGDLILAADNYGDIKFDDLNKNYTYMFELVSPYTRVVIGYDSTHLYHIGTRNNQTGEEYDIDLGIDKPKKYLLNSLEQCVKAVEEMNPDIVEDEGFVVVDKYYNRVKIKSPKYFMYHNLYNNGNLTSKRIIEIVQLGEVDDVIKQFPVLSIDILKYAAAINILNYKIQDYIFKARNIFEEFDGDRKATAEEIKKFDYPAIGFWAIDNSGIYSDYINDLTKNSYSKLVENEVSKI